MIWNLLLGATRALSTAKLATKRLAVASVSFIVALQAAAADPRVSVYTEGTGLFDAGPTFGQVLLTQSYDLTYGGRFVCDSITKQQSGRSFVLRVAFESGEPSAICEHAQSVSLGDLEAGFYSIVAQLARVDGTLVNEVSSTFEIKHRDNVCNVSPPNRLLDLYFDGKDAQAFVQRFASDAAFRDSLAGITIAQPRSVNGHTLVSAEFDALADPDRVLTTLRTSGEFSLVRYYAPESCGFSLCPSNTSRKAFEFFSQSLDQYFYSDDPAEAAILDAANSGWVRTGESFDVIYQYGQQLPVEGSVQRVYRFWNSQPQAKAAHFFTVSQQECAVLRDGGHAGWQFEGSIFWARVPQAGACAYGQPLYRVYNNGMGGAPAHRFTTRLDLVSTMASQGWVSEGVAMCVGDFQ